MAASSAHRTTGPCRMLASALLLAISLLNAGVLAQEEEVVTETKAPSVLMPNVRGDMIPRTTAASEPEDPQLVVFPTAGPLGPQQEGDDKDSDEGAEAKVTTAAAQTDAPIVVAADTPSPVPARGDGPNNIPQVRIYDVVCVGKEAVQDKNAVSLKLKTASSCEETKAKIESVLPELCGADCRLEIFQEDNSNEMIVSGKDVEDDVSGMATKFNNDNVKDKTDVEEAVPRWGKSSKLVLVSLLLTGLLLAVLLVAGYYLKTHRKNSKGVRLAESFQVDEENQANTLVSVAPLPQEPLDKPTENGESPPENGTNASPTTNGHSATQVPVADTEM